MSCCVLCAREVGLECVKVDKPDVIRFLCSQLNINFEMTFGEFIDRDSLLQIPFCQDCHPLFIEVSRAHQLLEEVNLTELKVKGELDTYLDKMKGKVTPSLSSEISNGVLMDILLQRLRTGIVRWVNNEKKAPENIQLTQENPEQADTHDADDDLEIKQEDEGQIIFNLLENGAEDFVVETTEQMRLEVEPADSCLLDDYIKIEDVDQVQDDDIKQEEDDDQDFEMTPDPLEDHLGEVDPLGLVDPTTTYHTYPVVSSTSNPPSSKQSSAEKMSEKFQCQLCTNTNELFDDMQSFEIHVGQCHKTAEMVYHCSVPGCTTKCNSYSLLQNHIKSHFKGTKKLVDPAPECYECPHCTDPKRRFKLNKSLQRHLKQDHNGPNFTKDKNKLIEVEYNKSHEYEFRCHFCKYSSAFPNNLRNHEVVKHRLLLIHICTKCKWKFATPELLQAHIPTHNSEGPFICLICQNTCETDKLLQEHIIRSHLSRSPNCPIIDFNSELPVSKALVSKKKPKSLNCKPDELKNKFTYECDKCEGKRFETRDKLTIHKGQYHPYTCELPQCEGLTWKTYNCILKHSVEIHETAGKEEKSLKCPKAECGKGFVTNYMLTRHIKHHDLDSTKPLSCEICDARYAAFNTEALQFHMEQRHLKPVKYMRYPCTVKNCKYKPFNRRSRLQEHLKRIHPEVLIYGCTRCKQAFSVPEHLVTHMNTHLESGPFECTVCVSSQRFPTADLLTDHLKKHTGEEIKKCPKCKDSFNSEYKLQVHLMKKHGHKKRFPCEYCDKAFHMNIRLENHFLETHLPAQKVPKTCNHCQAKFTSNSQLCYHIQRKGSTCGSDIIRHTKEKPFKCEVCQKTFVCEFYMNKCSHRGTIFGKCAFKVCEHCGKKFTSFKQLRSHLYKEHKITQPKKPCPICGVSVGRLNEHIVRMHKGRARHSCYFCAKTMGYSAINGHYNSHTLERPFKCEICHAMYSSSAVWSRHRSTVHREKPKRKDVNQVNVLQLQSSSSFSQGQQEGQYQSYQDQYQSYQNYQSEGQNVMEMTVSEPITEHNFARIIMDGFSFLSP